MPVSTRSMSRSRLAATVSVVPADLWILIASQMGPSDLPALLQACTFFSRLKHYCWKAVCERCFPDWTALMTAQLHAGGSIDYRQCCLLFTQRGREKDAALKPAALLEKQKLVRSRHRAILCEWLTEVTCEWGLPSTVVYSAVNLLDQYLSREAVVDLGKFQLVGVACLRAAVEDAGLVPPSMTAGEKEAIMHTFSAVTNETFTDQQVDEMTVAIKRVVPAIARKTPTAQIFLRIYWYTATSAGILSPQHMHIYSLASFLLQLSLLDVESRAFLPSLNAASCFSAALDRFKHGPSWPVQLQIVSGYLPADLVAAKARLAHAQATLKAPHLRANWCRRAEAHEYSQFAEQWESIVLVMKGVVAC